MNRGVGRTGGALDMREEKGGEGRRRKAGVVWR